MTYESAKKELEGITPNGLTLMEFMTYLCNICCAVFYFTKFHAFKFDQSTVNFLRNIWNFDTALFLFLSVIIFIIIDIVQSSIKDKFNFKYDEFNWKIMTEQFVRLFAMFISIYLLEIVLFYIDGKEVENLSNYQNILIMVYIIILFYNFVRITMEIFKERDYGIEKSFDKSEYINNTIEKFEKKDIDEIQKRVLLCQLCELTSKLYDEGIKIDEDYFRREKLDKIYAEMREK